MVALATFRVEGKDDTAFPVKFNPTTLKVTLSNKLQDEESGAGGSAPGGQARQSTRVTTTKLDLELLFDSTDDGSDVRGQSGQVRALAIAPEGEHPRPPTVNFRWGRFAFTGVIESFNESLDFWSSEGVPLRSTVTLSLQGTKLDDVAPDGPAQAQTQVRAGGAGTTGTATSLGDPNAGRLIAAANGIEDMRMAAGGLVTVSAGIQLKAAAGFSASAGIGIGISVGGGAAAGFGAGATAGTSGSAGLGASIGFRCVGRRRCRRVRRRELRRGRLGRRGGGCRGVRWARRLQDRDHVGPHRSRAAAAAGRAQRRLGRALRRDRQARLLRCQRSCRQCGALSDGCGDRRGPGRRGATRRRATLGRRGARPAPARHGPHPAGAAPRAGSP